MQPVNISPHSPFAVRLLQFLFAATLVLAAATSSAQVVSGDYVQLSEGTQNRDDPFVQFQSNGGATNSYIWTQLTASGGRMVFAHNGIEFMEVEPDVQSATLWLDNIGIGVGHNAPSEMLHLEADGVPFGNAKIFVENAHPVSQPREMLEMKNNGPVELLLNDQTFSMLDIGNRWSIKTTATNEIDIGLAGFDSGVIYLRGDMRVLSDRNAKEDFAELDAKGVLAKVIELPVTSWRFKSEGAGRRHIGPTAQDFHATFGLGGSDTAISPTDAIGVALAAIQGLDREIEARDARIDELEASLKQLVERLGRLETARSDVEADQLR